MVCTSVGQNNRTFSDDSTVRSDDHHVLYVAQYLAAETSDRSLSLTSQIIVILNCMVYDHFVRVTCSPKNEGFKLSPKCTLTREIPGYKLFQLFPIKAMTSGPTY